MLNCVLYNARSIVNKIDNLLLEIDSHNIDCVFIIESWLDSSIPDSLIVRDRNFTVLRKDRNRAGGGVCMLLGLKVVAVPVNIPSDFLHLELYSVDIVNVDVKFRVILLYRPPGYDAGAKALIKDIVDCVDLLASVPYPTLLIGDLNLPNMDWHGHVVQNNDIYEPFNLLIQGHGFVQFVKASTRNGNLLDVVLCNDSFLVSDCCVDSPLGCDTNYGKPSDHDSVHFKLQCLLKSRDDDLCDQHTLLYDFKRADYDGLNQFLMSVDWSAVLVNCQDVNIYWQEFVKVLNLGIDKFVPSRMASALSAKCSKSYPKFIQRLYKKKQCAWRSYKRFKTERLKEKYEQVETKCRTALSTYFSNIENRLSADADLGKFYKYVNNRIVSRTGTGAIKNSQGELVVDDEKKADCFNRFFSSVFTRDNGNCPAINSRSMGNRLCDITFSYDLVHKAIKSLKMKKSAGPDGLSSSFIKNVAEGVSYPLMLIFDQSFCSGKLPDIWKTALVTPIFKKGLACELNNYRPISLTCTCCKIMETITKNQMLEYLLLNNFISKHQHGFLSKHSTCSQLIECTNDWTLALRCRNAVDVAYIDFSKAFDSVCHNKLYVKLQSYGIDGKLLSWIREYLSDRTQRVKIGRSMSGMTSVLSGVPQGSVLGPLLFLLFINDIIDEFGDFLSVKLFADDIKIYAVLDNVIKSDLLQAGLNKLHQWSVKWQLNLNISKCFVLNIGINNAQRTYHINDTALSNALDAVDLGVTVDSKLRFYKHVSAITSKAHQRAALILRCFKSRDPYLLFRAFCVYVRPILEYCSSVWNPVYKCDIRMLEGVQRRFTKKLSGCHSLSYSNRLLKLGAESLQLRRLKADLVMMYRSLFGHVNIDTSNLFRRASNSHNTRGHLFKLDKEHGDLNCRMHSFACRSVNVWNSLPADIFKGPVLNGNVNAFKLQLSNLDFTRFLCSLD